jgi:DNA-binding NtrC family response regulator
MKSILLIDDEIQTLEICKRKLGKQYDVFTADKLDIAFEILANNEISCIISDLVMPGTNDLKFIEELQKISEDCPILVMSGKATVKMAVQAMQAGAYDFIEKPILNLDILTVMVEKALASQYLKRENKELKQQLSKQKSRKDFIGNCKEINKVLNVLTKVAPLNTTVLLHGETGTGKEMVARLIHEESPRAGKEFIAVNFGAIPETLLESLLFGHEKGSFTGATKDSQGYFETAHKSTLFLDEIGETTPAFQVKLLRVLQEKKIRRVGSDKLIPIDVRIIAATNRDLEEEVRNGNFRKDLFYRLNVIKIVVPPLRQRIEDIPLLAYHFLNEFQKDNGLSEFKISHSAMKVLTKHTWEGNVRELQNVVEHAAVLCSAQVINSEDLPEYMLETNQILNTIEFSDNYDAAKQQFELIYFKNLLSKCDSITEAATKSGFSRQNIHLKIKKLGIENN